MSEIRVCFLGTPEFAATSLKAILDDEHFKVVGVVTQPDRPKGRDLNLTASPVKELALKNNLIVLTPESLKKQRDFVEQIKTWKAEVAIVVAFGQILDQTFLDLFPYGCVNVHASLLPRWRGAAPIQRSLEAGDLKTGVCLQKMVLKLDAGDVLGSREVILDNEMNSLELHDKLSILGAELLKVELMDYIRGNLVALPQDENHVSVAKKIDKAESLLDFKQPAESIHNKTRAFVWGPGVFTHFQKQRLKIHKTRPSTKTYSVAPGAVADVQEKSFFIQTGTTALEILEVQPESKSKMTAQDFISRYKLQTGVQLGS